MTNGNRINSADQPDDDASARGRSSPASSSFCVPKAAIQALLDAKANAMEVCSYLVLARFTEASGMYSSASLSAVRRYTGANMKKGGPIDRALVRLRSIRASRVERTSNGKSGKAHAFDEHRVDLGPLIVDRSDWIEKTGENLAALDGPTPRSAVTFVVPNHGEELQERVWFGSGLVDGFGKLSKPLSLIRHGGDVLARLLLAMYAANDLETWGGVNPLTRLWWYIYEPVGEDIELDGGARLIRAKRRTPVASIDARVSGGDDETYWDAVRRLESSGLFYEVVTVLNRNGEKATFKSGGEYLAIPKDAEPLYELDTRSSHGYKPVGEEGIGGITARTAGELGWPVTLSGGEFDGTYAAIVPTGQGAMVVGIFRPRFRVANSKSAWVKSAWSRIHEGNEAALEVVQRVRLANGLEPTAT